MSFPMQVFILVLLLLNLAVCFFLLTRSYSSAGEREQKVRWDVLDRSWQRMEQGLREELAKIREELHSGARSNREELQYSLKDFGQTLSEQFMQIATLQKNQLEIFAGQLQKLTITNEEKLEKMRETVEGKLARLQEENSRKLEEMRVTVDEKLHMTLEKRLGESFKLVSDRLELVHKGLGEMQMLAAGVGDLKKVLTNVKIRGTLGEIQLGSILEQLLSPEQYSTNVAVKKGGKERVEYAVKLPGPSEDQHVWLPLDAKFPLEDYQRLLEAYDRADSSTIEAAAKQLEVRIKACAREISQKYLSPPETTDFGLMFLPVEGLFAEVLRRQGLFETLQRDFRVIVTGPTTLAALLNSLQMGFKTLAIQKRSGEVWSLLGAVKTDFWKLGEILEKTHRKILEAGRNIENATRKTGVIQRKLKDVQELPDPKAGTLLDIVE